MLAKNKYDEEKFLGLYEKYSKMILKVAYTYLKSTNLSEDIMQEVFLKYINKNPKFENNENEKAWFIRVTINLCKDYLKSFWIKRKREMPEDISYLQHYEVEMLTEVMKLQEKYRIVVYLYYYEQYTIKEISKILKTNENTIGVRLARAREQLKNNLQGGWDDE